MLFLIGKMFPIRGTRLVPEINLGIVWEVEDPYLGNLAEEDRANNVTFIIRPNIRF